MLRLSFKTRNSAYLRSIWQSPELWKLRVTRLNRYACTTSTLISSLGLSSHQVRALHYITWLFINCRIFLAKSNYRGNWCRWLVCNVRACAPFPWKLCLCRKRDLNCILKNCFMNFYTALASENWGQTFTEYFRFGACSQEEIVSAKLFMNYGEMLNVSTRQRTSPDFCVIELEKKYSNYFWRNQSVFNIILIFKTIWNCC